MKRNYHTLDNRGKANERKLVQFLAQNGQQILPMVELITETALLVETKAVFMFQPMRGTDTPRLAVDPTRCKDSRAEANCTNTIRSRSRSHSTRTRLVGKHG